jgi:hypothetical protein
MNTDPTADWISAATYDAAGIYRGTDPAGGEWFRVSYPYTVSVKSYFLGVKLSTYATEFIRQWKLLGSRDFGATWEMMDDKNVQYVYQTWTTSNLLFTLPLSIQSRTYTDVKLVITRTNLSQTTASCQSLFCVGCQHDPAQ